MGDPGVIDQHINAAKLLDSLCHTGLNPFGIGDITTQAQRLDVVVAAQVLHQAVEGLLFEVKYHQARTGLGETQHQRTADTGATTGDQHHLALIHLAGKYLAIHRSPRLQSCL